jgi:hypothetical protein
MIESFETYSVDYPKSTCLFSAALEARLKLLSNLFLASSRANNHCALPCVTPFLQVPFSRETGSYLTRNIAL